MRITKLILEKFKKADKVELNLHPINVLVGGNNSGKSSVLQGIHFSVIAAIASRQARRDTYTQDSLMFCPARNFEDLRHGTPYANKANFGFLRLFGVAPEGEDVQYEIRIYRGRNEGNVGCIRTGSPKLAALVASAEKLFSIYVPGLAGVPQSEQYRTESVVRRGVASGDANLYLRNVLWLIKEKGLIAELEAAMRNLFPKFVMWLEFDSKLDVYINVEVSVTGNSGRRCPLELVGTGVLQSLQIFSYVTLFAPMLLLLDEPDSHLHPDNQVLLAHALEYIASNTSTVVILSTHSRHLVDALQDDSNFAWLKDGKVYQQGQGIDKLPLLMDLGALDSFDRLLAGTIKYVFLTEDTDMAMLKMIAKHIGLKENEVLFFSYKTSSNLEPAKILARFIKDITPNTEVYIHRDRDFMTDSEVSVIKGKISSSGATPFITDGCDLESYFLEPDHLALLLNVDNNMVEDWLNTIAQSNHAQLQHSFTRKRDDIKKLLYRDSPETCPNTLALIGNDIPLPSQLRHGKEMLKKARKEMHSHFSKTIDPIQISTALDIPSDLVSLAITL